MHHKNLECKHEIHDSFELSHERIWCFEGSFKSIMKYMSVNKAFMIHLNCLMSAFRSFKGSYKCIIKTLNVNMKFMIHSNCLMSAFGVSKAHSNPS